MQDPLANQYAIVAAAATAAQVAMENALANKIENQST